MEWTQAQIYALAGPALKGVQPLPSRPQDLRVTDILLALRWCALLCCDSSPEAPWEAERTLLAVALATAFAS